MDLRPLRALARLLDARRAKRLQPPLSIALGLVVAIAGAAALTAAPRASASVCSASAVTVTPLHSPDGTLRPFYGDFSNRSTKRSGYVGYELGGAALGSDVWIRLSGFSGGSVGLAANQSAAVPVRATSQAGRPLVFAYLTATAATATAQAFTVEVWNGRPGQTGSTQVCAAGDGFSKVLNVIAANPNSISSIAVSNSSPALGGTVDVTAIGNTGTMGAGDSGDQDGGKGVFSMAPAMDDSWPADAFTLTGVELQMRSGATTTLSARDRLRVYPSSSSAQDYTAVYKFAVRKTTGSATTVLPVQNIASGTQVKYTGSYPASIPPIQSPALTISLAKSVASIAGAGSPYRVGYEVSVTNTATTPITIDYLRDTPTPVANWTRVLGSATVGGDAAPDPLVDADVLVFSGPFTVPARVGSTNGTLTFTYALDVTGPITNSVVGRVGDVSVGAAGGANEVTLDPEAPVVSTATLPEGTVGAAYTETLAATGGTGSYTWDVSSGSLPAGLTLDDATGVISGTPTEHGAASFTVRVTDGGGGIATRGLTLTVQPAGGAPDTTAPAGALVLAGGSTTTSSTEVTAALSATDDLGVTGYRIAAGTDCSEAPWVDVASTASFSESAAVTLPAGDGAKTVCAQFRDAAGNVATVTGGITLDTSRPAVTLTTAASDPTNGAFVVTAEFSEDVTGLTLADLTIGNGTASDLAGLGSTYTFTVTPAGDGTTSVALGSDAVTDAAGNGNTAATTLSRAIETVKPSLALTTTAVSPVAGAFSVTATFSESVTGFTDAGVSIENGSVSAFTGSGTTYTFTVTPSGDGAVTVDVAAGAASDAAGNGNTAAPQLARTADVTRPSVSLSSASASPVSGAFTVTATFSEPVTGFVAADVTVGNGSLAAFAGSGATYTFTVSPAADGAVTVDVAADVAADAAGNGNTAAIRLEREADLDAPSVVLSTEAWSPISGAFAVAATFSEPVSGFDASKVTVSGGTISAFAGAGSSYSFTVTPSADGPVRVDVPPGAATDSAGNSNTAAAQLSRLADLTPPGVVLATASGPFVGGAFAVTATFSEPVTGFSAGGLTVANGTVSGFSGSGSSYGFTITPAAEGAVTVDVAAAVAADAAGNPNTAAARLARTFDATAPVVTATKPPPPTVSGRSATIAFEPDKPSTLTCSLDGGAFGPCASPLTLTGLTAGPHTLVVRATDAAGNTGEETIAWTVAPPALVYALAPPPEVEEGNAAFTWDATWPGLTFTCSLDGGPFRPCASPYDVLNLIDGEHTFTVRAQGAGHVATATARWTIRRGALTPAVVIIPRIDPTDLVGRPQAFAQSVDPPRSSGPFTRRLEVNLRVPTPLEVERVIISNHPDFRDQRVFPASRAELYAWELLPGPSGNRRVYIRYADAPDAPTGTATIVLDQELPRLRPRPFWPKRRATAAIPPATPAGRACGAAPRRWLDIRSQDGFSGLNAVQIASDRKRPCAWRPYLPVISYRTPGRIVWVRVADRVGNVSAWYRVRATR